MAITIHAAATPVRATLEGVTATQIDLVQQHWTAISQVISTLFKLMKKTKVVGTFKLLDEPLYSRPSKWKLMLITDSATRSNLLEALALMEHFKDAKDGSWKGFFDTDMGTVFAHAVDTDGELVLTVSYGG